MLYMSHKRGDKTSWVGGGGLVIRKERKVKTSKREGVLNNVRRGYGGNGTARRGREGCAWGRGSSKLDAKDTSFAAFASIPPQRVLLRLVPLELYEGVELLRDL